MLHNLAKSFPEEKKVLDQWVFVLDHRVFVLDQWVFVLDQWVFVLDQWVFVLDQWVFVLDQWVFVLDHRVFGLRSSFLGLRFRHSHFVWIFTTVSASYFFEYQTTCYKPEICKKSKRVPLRRHPKRNR